MISVGKTWTLLLAGDIMLNAIAPSAKIFKGITPELQKAGLAFANLEVPLTNAKVSTPHKSAAELKAKSQFILKADPRNAIIVSRAGFAAVTLGNNHCMDYRAAGLAQMVAQLDTVKVAHAGAGKNAAEALKIAVVKAPDGTRVGLLSGLAFMSDGALAHCTPATAIVPGINVFRFGGRVDDKVRARLGVMARQAKTKCDLLLIGMHWGIERQTVPTDYQVNLARAWIDAGADIVWGHHPHVLQGTEVYHGKPILYSMGNLVSPIGSKTGLAVLTFEGLKFKGLRGIPCEISGGKVREVKGKDPFPSLDALVKKRYPQRSS